jgi:hypothetical protein
MGVFGPTLVYLLCLATSLTCAVLLTRAYLRQRLRLQLWVAAAFGAFTLNNLILVGDMVLLPSVDLWVLRQLTGALGFGFLLYGFITEADR